MAFRKLYGSLLNPWLGFDREPLVVGHKLVPSVKSRLYNLPPWVCWPFDPAGELMEIGVLGQTYTLYRPVLRDDIRD